jgi:hypothetical protein
MGVTDFDTKVAVVVRDDLATWQRSDLDLVGLALRAPHRDAEAVLRGVKRHP